MFRQDFTCPALLEDASAFYPYGAITVYGGPFQVLQLKHCALLGCSAFARRYLRNLG